jgi:hypothetical protein
MMTPEQLALRQSLDLCVTHRDTLRDTLADMRERALAEADLEALSKADRRLLDQFALVASRIASPASSHAESLMP